MLDLEDLTDDHPLTLTEKVSHLAAQRLGVEVQSLEFRRDIAAAGDISIIFRSRDPLDAHGRHAMGQKMASGSAIESVRLSKNRISIRLTGSAIGTLLQQAVSPTALEKPSLYNGEPVLVAFGDPNLTKALHLGHLRNLALGHALASLLRYCGAQVKTQSVACDIGRNVAEAVAGYEAFAATAAPGNTKPDHLIGFCYSEYVRARGGGQAAAGPDAPIMRELTPHHDRADAILHGWSRGDASVLTTWKRVIRAVESGHAVTLQALGIRFDRTEYESQAVAGVPDFLQRGMSKDVFAPLADGVIAYHTGRSDYPTMILTRSDGFPTEHLRALILWDELRHRYEHLHACYHVMGDEWLTGTQLREEVLRKLANDGFFRKYKPLPYAMVTLGGEKMKSADGQALLIDTLCAALRSSPLSQDLPPEDVVRTGALGAFLAIPPRDPLEVIWTDLTDPGRNGGLRILSALVDLSAGPIAPARLIITSPTRFAVFQAERMRRAAQDAAAAAEPLILFRCLQHMAARAPECGSDPHAAGLLKRTLRQGLAALGLLSDPG